MILRDLRKRRLKLWRCTIADGHLGLWAALGEEYPQLAQLIGPVLPGELTERHKPLQIIGQALQES